MAFNFNWSPLIADTDRAKHMLTAALNKSPKPPIIVDDIIVNELNLGTIPPELEILEVGDLAADRFRGIFKMSYQGDAFLTLKTKVQANPLHTYLSTKSDFASPQPLAAASGLTIPLQITLSDIRLSGFVILVFSRQKGITLVFRNDPLESLKVSSTFDAIPFVRNYLQKEIEAQLRVLFMDDLPAIIHRLSLKMWDSEYKYLEESRGASVDGSVDAKGPLDSSLYSPYSPMEVSDLDITTDNPTEIHASFSQKNLLRLAALTESQRTLSLFTPTLRDTVFRAWASARDSADTSGVLSPNTRPHALQRLRSSIVTHSAWSSAASVASEVSSHSSRPSVSHQSTAATVYTMGSSRSRTSANKKRKHRTINLRRNKSHDALSGVEGLDVSCQDPFVSASAPNASPVNIDPPIIGRGKSMQTLNIPTTPHRKILIDYPDPDTTPRATFKPLIEKVEEPLEQKNASTAIRPGFLQRSFSATSLGEMMTQSQQNFTGGILEQAWLMKIKADYQNRLIREKGNFPHGSRPDTLGGDYWNNNNFNHRQDSPPPAYAP